MPNRRPFNCVSERGKIMKINDKIYDVLAYVGKIVLPGLAVLYSTIAETWGLPFPNEVSATIMAIDVFLNALLGVSSVAYYKEQAESTSIVDANESDKG